MHVQKLGVILAVVIGAVIIVWITTYMNTGHNMFERFHIRTPIYVETIYIH